MELSSAANPIMQLTKLGVAFSSPTDRLLTLQKPRRQFTVLSPIAVLLMVRNWFALPNVLTPILRLAVVQPPLEFSKNAAMNPLKPLHGLMELAPAMLATAQLHVPISKLVVCPLNTPIWSPQQTPIVKESVITHVITAAAILETNTTLARISVVL